MEFLPVRVPTVPIGRVVGATGEGYVRVQDLCTGHSALLCVVFADEDTRTFSAGSRLRRHGVIHQNEHAGCFRMARGADRRREAEVDYCKPESAHVLSYSGSLNS